ncbi:MAG: lipoyl(octanoyl) transferase LipB [Oligoflexales bacterium]
MYRNDLATLNVYKLGLLSYESGCSVQTYFHKLVVREQSGPCLLLLEHQPVITFGKSSDIGFLKSSKRTLELSGIDLCVSDRGGQLTAHAPGQLLAYPIIPIRKFGLGVKAYVTLLEQAVINLLRRWGVHSQRDEEFPGVWHEKSKICALGIRIKDRVSMHGLAINVNADLAIFSHIVPCGIVGRSVVNLESLIQEKLDLSNVAEHLAREIGKLLNLKLNFDSCSTIPKNSFEQEQFVRRGG